MHLAFTEFIKSDDRDQSDRLLLWSGSVPPIRWKEIVRRVDHSVIFVMIGGTYRPLAANRLQGETGTTLTVFVWVVAFCGIMLNVLCPHRHQGLRFTLYLLLGWTILVVIHPFSSAVKPATLVFLVSGGVAYSIGGAWVHLLGRMRFHNAMWHALVLLAASLHFSAMATGFVS